MARGQIVGGRAFLNQNLARAGFQILHHDLPAVYATEHTDLHRKNGEQDGVAAGQELGIHEQLIVFGGDQYLGPAAVGGDALNALGRRSEQDSLGIPTCPVRRADGTDRDGRAAGDRETFHDLSEEIGEGHGFAIGGEDGVDEPVRQVASADGMGFQLGERPKIELAVGHVDNLGSIGGDRDGQARGTGETLPFRNQDSETHDGAGGRGLQIPGERGGRGEEQSGGEHSGNPPERSAGGGRVGGGGLGGGLRIGEVIANGDAGFADIAEALFGIAGEAAREETANGRRRLREVAVDGVLENRGQGVGDGFAGEEALAGEQLVKDDTEAPDIGAAIDGFAGGLFRSHVGGGAEDQAGLGGADGESGRIGAGGGSRGLGGFGEAESEYLDDAFGGDFDVGGLEVAVDDAFFVGSFESFGNL